MIGRPFRKRFGSPLLYRGLFGSVFGYDPNMIQIDRNRSGRPFRKRFGSPLLFPAGKQKRKRKRRNCRETHKKQDFWHLCLFLVLFGTFGFVSLLASALFFSPIHTTNTSWNGPRASCAGFPQDHVWFQCRRGAGKAVHPATPQAPKAQAAGSARLSALRKHEHQVLSVGVFYH